MKKRIFSLLFMFAALTSVCTLESCKDTNEDNYNDLRIELQKRYDDLLDRIDCVKICGVDCEEVASRVATLETEMDEVQADLKNLNDVVIPAIKTRLDNLETEVADLEKQVEALRKQATGVSVQSVYTPAFGVFNSSFGINSTVLIAYHGETDTDLDFHGTTISGKLISDEADNAGTIYLTVDPSNVDFTGKPVTLVNSVGEKAGVTLSDLAISSHVITVGYTRAATNYLYETKAQISDPDAVQHLTVDTTAIKDAIKDVEDPTDGIDLGNIANTIYEAINTGLYANAIQLTNADAYETRSIVSKYEIAATCVTPLNLHTLDPLADTDLNRVYNAIIKYGNKIMNQVKEEMIEKYGTEFISENVKDIKFEYTGGNVVLTGSDTKTGETVEVTLTADKLKEIFGNNTSADEINKYVADVNNYIAKVNNAWTRVTTESVESYAGTYIQRVLDKVAKYIHRVPETVVPQLFVVNDGRFELASQIEALPTVLTSGDAELFASSETLELLVPFYKKYLKATSGDLTIDGSSVNGKVFDGTKRSVKLNGATGTFSVTYDVVDFAGNPDSYTFYFKVGE